MRLAGGHGSDVFPRGVPPHLRGTRIDDVEGPADLRGPDAIRPGRQRGDADLIGPQSLVVEGADPGGRHEDHRGPVLHEVPYVGLVVLKGIRLHTSVFPAHVPVELERPDRGFLCEADATPPIGQSLGHLASGLPDPVLPMPARPVLSEQSKPVAMSL